MNRRRRDVELSLSMRRRELSAEIKGIVEAQNAVRTETSKLVNALRAAPRPAAAGASRRSTKSSGSLASAPTATTRRKRVSRGMAAFLGRTW